MSQLPKDPQQLAQDILAGRISIQQLQAEQARRRTAQEALRQTMRTRPAASTSSAPQAGNRQVVKPSGQPARPPGRQSRPSAKGDRYTAVPAVIAKRSPSQGRAAAAAQADAASEVRTSSAPAKTSTTATAKSAAVPRTPSQTIRAVMNNPYTLRSVFVLSELLDKPLSLRQDPLDRF